MLGWSFSPLARRADIEGDAEERGPPPFLNVILCSQTSNSIPAAQRTLLHADQGDQACDQAQDPEREHAPENVCQIDAKCVCRRCGEYWPSRCRHVTAAAADHTAAARMRRRKKRGRPTTGREPMMTFRMPVDLRKAVDRWAARKDATRSEAIRALIVRGLKK